MKKNTEGDVAMTERLYGEAAELFGQAARQQLAVRGQSRLVG
jgi:hypothetical protein